jgi:hypothetical protein
MSAEPGSFDPSEHVDSSKSAKHDFSGSHRSDALYECPTLQAAEKLSTKGAV